MIFIKRFKPHIAALNFLEICVAVAAFLISLLCVVYLKRFELLMYIIVGAVCSLAFVIDFILLPLWFSRTTYTVTEEMITKKGGLFFFTKQFMKTDSVQYVSVVKLPFSKLNSFNFIIVHALGGVIVMQFLSSVEADQMAKLLNGFAKKDKQGGS